MRALAPVVFRPETCHSPGVTPSAIGASPLVAGEESETWPLSEY